MRLPLETILPALTISFGLQILRTLWPYLRYLLHDRLNVSPVQAGLIGLAILAVPFLWAWLERRLGVRRLLLVSAGGLGVARLGMQLWSGDPVGDFILAVIGAICFGFFLPTYFAVARSLDPSEGPPRYAGSILLGLALDLALHGLFLSYDPIWQSGLIPLLITLSLVAAQGVALWLFFPRLLSPVKVGAFGPALPWLGFGPFLALQIVALQNPAYLAGLSGWAFPYAFAWVLFCHLAAFEIALHWQPRRRLSLSLVGLGLVVSLFLVAQPSPWLPALAWLGAQVTLAILLRTMLRGQVEEPGPALRGAGLAHGAGMMVMGIFALVMSLSLVDQVLPLQPGWLFGFTGGLIALSALGSLRPDAELRQAGTPTWLRTKLHWGLLLCPLYVWLTWYSPVPVAPTSPSARVMTYNVHNGFNSGGQLDLEGLAQVVEAIQPDILALQEVSRGDIGNGGGDMLSWLSQRLRMPYVYTPGGETLWGQVTFSRYPILRTEAQVLPPDDLAVRRSFLYTQIELGQETSLHLINNHFHALRRRDEPIRQQQAQAILDFLAYQNISQALVAGDLNALPDSPTLQTFYEANFADVIAGAELVPGYTASSTYPVVRIDYILVTPGLRATQVAIPVTTASDHLPVVAVIEPEVDE